MKKLLVILAAFLLMTAPVVFADDGPPYAPQESGYSLLTSGATTEILVGGGAGIVPVWTTATGSGAPVRASDPTINGTLTVIPLGSDLYAIDVQGATNDYTGAGTLIGFKLARDINIGTGNVAGAAGWQSYLNQKHTNAALTGDRELYGGISRIDNQGSITNEGTDDWQYYSFGMHSTAKMDPGTVFDTDSTGKLEIVFAGLYGYAFGDANYTIADSGTDVPANTVIGAG